MCFSWVCECLSHTRAGNPRQGHVNLARILLKDTVKTRHGEAVPGSLSAAWAAARSARFRILIDPARFGAAWGLNPEVHGGRRPSA